MKLSLLLLCTFMLGACALQHTPSTMNDARVELAHESVVEQIPMSNVNENVLDALANQYDKKANGPLDLTLTYDPESIDYTAMAALHDLKDIKMALQKKGVTDIVTQTLAVPDGKPSLMVTYDMLRAQAPSSCDKMPGLDTNKTGRFIDGYEFGCSVETVFAQQIARPSDLQGNAGMSERAARREAVIVEGQAAGVRNVSLQGLERDMVQSE